jgi:hypothetical protein
MLHSQVRSKQCRQIQLHEIHIAVDGVSATPAASGVDALFIASITDLGTGNYKITVKDKAQQNMWVQSIVPTTASRVWSVTAADKESVTVQFLNLSGVAADCNFNICMNWHGSVHTF